MGVGRIEDIEVIRYLKALRHFLYGDLANFQKFCELAEQIELSEGTIGVGSLEGRSGTSADLRYYVTQSNHSAASEIPEADHSNLHESVVRRESSLFALSNYFNYQRDGRTNEFFRGTIPNTLSLFATIDIVGYLLGQEQNSQGEGKANLRNYFSIKENVINLGEDDLSILITLYRNGMAHSFFPKREIGISYYSRNPENELFFLELSSENIILNVNYLIKITQEILDYVIDTSNLHDNLQTQFDRFKQYRQLSAGVISAFKERIKNRGIDID